MIPEPFRFALNAVALWAIKRNGEEFAPQRVASDRARMVGEGHLRGVR